MGERLTTITFRPATEPPETEDWGRSQPVLCRMKDGTLHVGRFRPDEEFGDDWILEGPDGYTFEHMFKENPVEWAEAVNCAGEEHP